MRKIIVLLFAVVLVSLPLSASADPIVVQIDPTEGGCHTLIVDEPGSYSATLEQCEIVAYVYNGSSFDTIPTSLWCNAHSCLPADDDDCLAVANLANPPFLAEDPAVCEAAINDGGNNFYEAELVAQEGFVMIGSLAVYGPIWQPPANNGR